ncbi:MAG: helical backbone metal receptor [Gemmatimonadales bacterium]
MRAITIAFISLLGLAACKRDEPERKPQTDDFGDAIQMGATPKRIVSLNPTTTELLFALGAGSRLVGRTTYDLFPDSAKNVPDVGPGLRPNVESILGTKPDLVVLYASNDNRAAARELRAAGINTLSIKIDHIADFYRASRLLGVMLGDSAKGAVVADSVEKTLKRVRNATASLTKPTIFWHIWDAPLITIASGSYMNELVEIAGGVNVYGDMSDVSPAVSIEDVVKRNPEFILAGPENAKKIAGDRQWSAVPAVRKRGILVVDTAVVGRPSVKLGEAAVSLAQLLHPGVVAR